MTNTFPDYSIDASSIDGLDPLFDEDGQLLGTTDGQMASAISQVATTNGQMATKDGQNMVTISEASRILQIPYSTLRRMIKNGELETISDEKGRKKLLLSTTSGHHLAKVGGHFWPNGHQVTKLENKASEKLVQNLEERNTKLEQQIQALIWRNGYLENQLEENSKTIKLLEDKQNIPWWRKSWFWFIGKRTS